MTNLPTYYLSFIIDRLTPDKKIKAVGMVPGDIVVKSGPEPEENGGSDAHWRTKLALDPEECPTLIDVLIRGDAAPQVRTEQEGERAEAIKKALELAFLAGFETVQGEVKNSYQLPSNEQLLRECTYGNAVLRNELQELMEGAFHQGRLCAELNPTLQLRAQ